MNDGKAKKVQISSALKIIIRQRGLERIPARDIRIINNGRYMKIDGHPDMDILADLCAKELSEDIRHTIDSMSSKYETGFGEARLSHDEKSRRSFDELFAELESIEEADGSTGVMIRSMTVQILACLGRRPPEAARFFPSCEGCTPDQAKTARAARGYILSHPSEKLCISGLADKFGMSQTKIKESIRLYYGESVGVMIRKEKMGAAAVLLEKTDMKISSIGERLGYMSAGKFTKAFREVMGVNPGEYRRSV